jgi:glycerol-3-phosphate dehydrogenase
VDRDLSLRRLDSERFDFLIVGGGATGAGIAVDAATRGYRTALVERGDFAQGTSSRSTKLLHGGVRYLAQGQIGLVRHALQERALLLRNAPHLSRSQEFLVPAYSWWERPYYGIGLTMYDLLAGSLGLGRTRVVGRGQAGELVPTVQRRGLRGGVVYQDGQFDDARLVIDLMRLASDSGAAVANYAEVVGLRREGGRTVGARVRDSESGAEFGVRAAVVVNSTGAWADGLRQMADASRPALIRPSQGIHVVFDGDLVPGPAALMVPKTDDGRVLFAIPWLGKTVVGTTDTPVPEALAEPRALPEELEFVRKTAARYIEGVEGRPVRSVFVGVRPLIGGPGKTSTLSRDHYIAREEPGLVTITGGKWTTYRRMAEELVTQAAAWEGLAGSACRTRDLGIAGPAHRYGERLEADVEFAVRQEMARSVVDFLSRRRRTLLLDAAEAGQAAEPVAREMARLLGRGPEWIDRQAGAMAELARQYQV